MTEYKNALEYIQSDKFKKFHKDRRDAKSKALAKARNPKGTKKTGEWDGEAIWRPKTLSERHKLK